MANERAYLYKVIKEDGCYISDKHDKAKRIFDQDGIRMYAYTKTLRPRTILLYWK